MRSKHFQPRGLWAAVLAALWTWACAEGSTQPSEPEAWAAAVDAVDSLAAPFDSAEDHGTTAAAEVDAPGELANSDLAGADLPGGPVASPDALHADLLSSDQQNPDQMGPDQLGPDQLDADPPETTETTADSLAKDSATFPDQPIEGSDSAAVDVQATDAAAQEAGELPSELSDADAVETAAAQDSADSANVGGDSATAADSADGWPPTDAVAAPVVWQGTFADAAPNLGFSLQLPPGVPKKPDQGLWAPLSLALIDDVNGDGLDDLFLATQGGSLAVAYGPVGPQTALQQLPGSGNGDPRIHSLAVLRRANQAPVLLTGGSPMAAWQLQGQGWVNIAMALGISKAATGLRYGITPVDLDSDGLLDLLVSDVLCAAPPAHLAWLDRGDGVFVPADPLDFPGYGAQWGAIAGDWDADGDLDVVWMHDGCGNPKTTQGFFRQMPRGADGWPVFERQQPHSLFAFPQAPVPYASPMGAAAVDIFNNGQAGLAIANSGLTMPLATAKAMLLGVDEADIFNVQNLLLVPKGDGSLVDVGAAAGLKGLVDPLKKLDMQAWAMVPLDFDADGLQDLGVATAAEPLGTTKASPGPSRPVLLQNQGLGKLTEVSAAVGLPAPLTAPLLAAGDIDGDGDTDLAFGRLGQPILLLANQVQTTGQRVRLRLRGQTSNPAAIGAQLTAQLASGPVSRWVGLDAPFATHMSHAVELGLGAVQAAAITIAWPSGYVQQLPQVAAGAQLVIDEPPLLHLSARRVAVGGSIEVTVTPRDPLGAALAVTAQAQVVQISPAFTWKAPLTCLAGVCKGTLVALDVAMPTTAFLQVSWPGTQLKVWPRLTALP
jgi:hypothetical protein